MQLGHHFIVTEGTKTEPYYFEGLKTAVESKGSKNKVHITGTGLHTTKLMGKAKILVHHAGIIFNHVWIVYDKDDFSNFEFNQVEKLCKDYSDDETLYCIYIM